jgi:hypothetical protein
VRSERRDLGGGRSGDNFLKAISGSCARLRNRSGLGLPRRGVSETGSSAFTRNPASLITLWKLDADRVGSGT